MGSLLTEPEIPPNRQMTALPRDVVPNGLFVYMQKGRLKTPFSNILSVDRDCVHCEASAARSKRILERCRKLCRRVFFFSFVASSAHDDCVTDLRYSCQRVSTRRRKYVSPASLPEHASRIRAANRQSLLVVCLSVSLQKSSSASGIPARTVGRRSLQQRRYCRMLRASFNTSPTGVTVVNSRAAHARARARGVALRFAHLEECTFLRNCP